VLAAKNVAKAFLLLGGFVGVFTAFGWWVGGIRLASVFFVVCLLMAATLHWYGPRIVLASLGARELTLAEGALLHTTVERLGARLRSDAEGAPPESRSARASSRPFRRLS
jgi:hypothetical protein